MKKCHGYGHWAVSGFLFFFAAYLLPQSYGWGLVQGSSLVFIPSPDSPVLMPTKVYRPQVIGTHPLVVISHGSSSNAELRALQDLSHFEDLASWFVRLGYVVAVPQRPGHGKTEGEWLEGAGSCEDPRYDRAGMTIAANIAASIRYLVKLAFIQKNGVIVVGHSAGGWGALALASQNPPSVSAVINFSGGMGGRSYDLPGRNCAPDRLITTAAKFGRMARLPTLWIYAQNDTYFGPDLSNAMARAFKSGGGDIQFHLLPAVGNDGHFLTNGSIAISNWSHQVEIFLRQLKVR